MASSNVSGSDAVRVHLQEIGPTGGPAVSVERPSTWVSEETAEETSRILKESGWSNEDIVELNTKVSNRESYYLFLLEKTIGLRDQVDSLKIFKDFFPSLSPSSHATLGDSLVRMAISFPQDQKIVDLLFEVKVWNDLLNHEADNRFKRGDFEFLKRFRDVFPEQYAKLEVAVKRNAPHEEMKV